MSFIAPVLISLAFLFANVLTLRRVLNLNLRGGTVREPADLINSRDAASELQASDILSWEFEYARATASEAMTERHTMVNFYLLIAGVVASGAVAVVDQNDRIPSAGGTVFLWLLCAIGWLYFLAIIRLRQAWYDSLAAMNQIKKFYVEHSKDLHGDVLREAFHWHPETMPKPGKPLTVYFYSTMIIAVLNSVAFAAGGALLDLTATKSQPVLILTPLGIAGLGYFLFHLWLYFAFLNPPDKWLRMSLRGAIHELTTTTAR